jgi:hypothetical protein
MNDVLEKSFKMFKEVKDKMSVSEKSMELLIELNSEINSHFDEFCEKITTSAEFFI